MSITKLLQIQYQFSKGHGSNLHYQLAAAVSEAGGLGIIASGGMTGAVARRNS